MKKHENLIIAALVLTAGILSTVLVWSLVATPEQAYADTSVRGGDYIVGTGAWSASRDLLYIINRSQRQLNVYAIDQNSKSLNRVQRLNLAEVFK